MTRSSGTTRPPSQRQLRVGELIRHALADILMRGELHEPGLNTAIITISQVRMAPDLRLATCYVMPLGGAGAEEAAQALQRHVRYLRGAVAKRIDLRLAPELRFRVDDTFAESARIDSLLRSPTVRADVVATADAQTDTSND